VALALSAKQHCRLLPVYHHAILRTLFIRLCTIAFNRAHLLNGYLPQLNFDELHSEIANRLGLNPVAVKTVMALFDEGCTIPFIARYRKDRTGGLDEVAIENIQQQEKELQEFYKRQTYIIEAVEALGKMNPALKARITEAKDMQALEDLYLPYKQRKKTKADMAREAGLEPLAKVLFAQQDNNIESHAHRFIKGNIKSIDEALQGARDIIAEWLNENADLRNRLRERFSKHGMLSARLVKSKEAEAQKYKDYFAYSERLDRAPSHRVMAVFRGVDEGFLRFGIEPDGEMTMELLRRFAVRNNSGAAQQVWIAAQDAYKRLLQPSLESEFKKLLWEKAEQQAINVFADNLKQLLLSAPLGSKRILAIDPGIRTGCKVVCLDAQGKLLTTAVIYIHQGEESLDKARQTIISLQQKYTMEAVAIGDGTAGRETEAFVKSLQLNLPVFMVNEDGASVYSASGVAREEFPDQDVTVRGTVSIGRRLMDPLAELVKIDPKAIGVGQYQHDVNAARLKTKLDQTVVSCVNHVGVNLNTASRHLLAYVSGLGPVLAQNIVEYRAAIGGFTNRNQLKEVPRLGSKAFEQSAGFLRINGGDNLLDASGVHPENYAVVKSMAKETGLALKDLIGNSKALDAINSKAYINTTTGELTVKDILNELKKPGLDPRQEAVAFQYAEGIYKMEDLRIGMVVPGMVSNITQFGAFVDIGVKQDGLVHISHLADRFIKDPNEVVKLQQKVMVKVLEVDVARKRITLSMKEAG
jgi:uncharacterized protein